MGGEYADERVDHYSDPSGPDRAFRRWAEKRAPRRETRTIENIEIDGDDVEITLGGE